MSEPKEMFEELESVVIRFAGDSGDGMQLTGTQFTNTTAVFGNDISTMPDFPSEIRAPAGTLAGVSGFQVNFSSVDVLTPGDAPHVLIAMNPAALRASLPDLMLGGIIIVNTDAFTPANLRKAGYESSPLEDESLNGYEVVEVPLTTLNREALKDIDSLTTKDKDRCQNFFALGLTFWLFDRPLETSLEWLRKKFASKPDIAEANAIALQTGFFFGETTEAFRHRYRIRPASLPAGDYRKVTGNEATAMGLVTAAVKANKPLFYGTYPITPASDILHALAPLRHFDVRTFQAEDEIAGMGSVIGASFGGAIAVTGTSGPGLALKSEAMNLAVALELPMVIVNVQRGGPSTGLPTKTEQSDLLQVMFGRNGESPVPVVAPQSPADCFDIAIQAVRMAVRASTPVVMLSDGFLGNSSEPWRLPNPDDIPPIPVTHPAGRVNGNGADEPFLPYARDPETLGRPWAIPGTPGLEHRIGGLSKAPLTGNVSYRPEHHEQMCHDRAEKVARLVDIIPDQEVVGPKAGDLLLVTWGGTYGAARSAAQKAQQKGLKVAHAHVRFINPFPRNLEELLHSYKHVLVAELNGGQLAFLLQGKFGMKVLSYPKLHGQPFKISEISQKIEEVLGQ
ncbi:MAG: 2-oxoacid:acceptor oxidoreductase subunit alpha [Anaerolineales bacterium]|nr:2-oxoacid:acceptor oxidoreductase subunit alpha [Anaerolineales bacterium]MCB8991698.1 2-oxoacid:acceptor oxidoreductase subunit alpha [Ardenticatenaceae bacterium]